MYDHDALVCPDCGSTNFRQDCTAIVRATGRFYRTAQGNVYPDTHSEEIIDVERDADYVCDDCGMEVAEDDLITEYEYETKDDYDE